MSFVSNKSKIGIPRRIAKTKLNTQATIPETNCRRFQNEQVFVREPVRSGGFGLSFDFKFADARG